MSDIPMQYYDSVVDGYSKEWLIEKYLFVMRHDPEHYVFILLNIKQFSYLHYLYGKEGSDDILKILNQHIQSYLDKDEYVAHLANDEFGILMKHNSVHSFLYGKMINLLESIYRIQDARIYRNLLTSSGIFSLSTPHMNFDEVYNLANLARKSSDTIYNRSHCYELYESSILISYKKERELEYKTSQAFLNYEFISFLQPKVNIKTGEIIGAESLLRWRDQEGNQIPLSDFLPILDKNSYIGVVDLNMFDVVCKFLDERLKQGKKIVPISFNFCKPNFYSPTIIEEYLNVFNKYSIPPEYIEFELMESITLDDTNRMKLIIQQLKDVGFKCALDDFGSGYSSFHVLLNANLDAIKMDRAFFTEELNEKNKTIIRTIINLIHSFKMEVIAEGIETIEYVDYLRECGCDAIQGYYYHKPMSMEQFNELLDESIEKKQIA